MPYVAPESVDSPRGQWLLHRVVVNRGEGEVAYAIGHWDGRPVICLRWNGNEDRPKGNPVSRGFPTWMVLPDEDYDLVVRIFTANEERYARRFLGLPDR